ncbi:carbohydrate ABC transporter permease [Gracilibacillus oryzae]|uniref:Carbohydrate ABC transporter permease n=2 Tax=Gracilibacillus oryzae TaxID=1672701 RepID=A0A7C8KMS3_9BACI|nr:carbohydrate ABC transporter permease [Gracilibacillus oryzae]
MMSKKWEVSVVGIILALGGLITSIPFIWMILSSFKTEREALSVPPTLIPNNVTLQNYIDLFNKLDFDIYLYNTMIIVFFSMIGLLLNTMAGYGFAIYRFRYKEILFLLVLATLMIPNQVTMIPTYLLVNTMGLTNTMTGIVLPGLISAYSLFLIRQFMATIPMDLIEAARLDGANEFRIFFNLILPLSKPIISIQMIFAFIGAWNSFLWPLIIANDDKLYTLSVGMSLLKGQYSTSFALQMAGATFMVIPILIIFTIFQRNIVQGFNMTGIK